MYEEKNSFSLRTLILQLLTVLLFVFIMIWLFPTKNYMENNSIEFFAEMCGISADRFAHLFKKEFGISPHKYITDVRIRQAKYLLEYSDLNINEVSVSVGFEDALYFSRMFKKYTGVSPQKYKG